MKKYTLSFVLGALILSSCSSKPDPFLISEGQVGALTTETDVSTLEELYSTDSLVKEEGRRDYQFANSDKYQLFEKGGKHLLTITPSSSKDSIRTPRNIIIHDERYTTAKGVSLNSTFKDIKGNYKISKIEGTLNNVIVFVNEIDAYFTIDREELPGEVRFNLSAKIEAVQIPDDAKIKYFMLGWENVE
ncbi:hypothetical protein GWK08_17470 [Leptobacterium flavescens]|uniref:Uncharacterized protein n=1 Tax=Leptobacterium flavescens TaxID=472055 RepID=A0A6P0URV7_9FLAO|nr:hypothetical protein [Leptobacterium flavescens]NER15250.1 hypothetical protein [Leptobacterium flavescens]